MASFLSDDPNCGSSLEELSAKLPGHVFWLCKISWQCLRPFFRHWQTARQQAQLKATVEALQSQAVAPEPPNPVRAPSAFVARPNLDPPPREK